MQVRKKNPLPKITAVLFTLSLSAIPAYAGAGHDREPAPTASGTCTDPQCMHNGLSFNGMGASSLRAQAAHAAAAQFREVRAVTLADGRQIELR